MSPDTSAGGLLSVPTLWPRASPSPLPEAPFLVHLTMHRAGPGGQISGLSRDLVLQGPSALSPTKRASASAGLLSCPFAIRLGTAHCMTEVVLGAQGQMAGASQEDADWVTPHGRARKALLLSEQFAPL